MTLPMTCRISGAAKQPSTRLMAMPTKNSINATRRVAPGLFNHPELRCADQIEASFNSILWTSVLVY